MSPAEISEAKIEAAQEAYDREAVRLDLPNRADGDCLWAALEAALAVQASVAGPLIRAGIAGQVFTATIGEIPHLSFRADRLVAVQSWKEREKSLFSIELTLAGGETILAEYDTADKLIAMLGLLPTPVAGVSETRDAGGLTQRERELIETEGVGYDRDLGCAPPVDPYERGKKVDAMATPVQGTPTPFVGLSDDELTRLMSGLFFLMKCLGKADPTFEANMELPNKMNDTRNILRGK